MQKQVDSKVIGQGQLMAIITDADGKKRTISLGSNTLCQQYLNAVAAWSVGENNTGQNPTSPPTQFILGKGTGNVSANDPSLFEPQAETQHDISVRTSLANTSTFTTNYNKGQLNDTYTEAGLLDANNNLMAHIVFQLPISVADTKAATFIWAVTWNAA